MLLLISSMNMLNAKPAEAKPNTSEMEDGAQKAAMGASIAVVPLTIPLLTGPATISTVVIYANQAQTWLQLSAAGRLWRGDRRRHRPVRSRWPIPSRGCWARPASTS